MRVLMAGSLIVPFDELEAAFEAAHPNVDVLMEGHGSIQCIRRVAELHEPADIVAVADHTLIPMLMYEALDPESQQPYADWYIEFATNHLTLAYTDQSTYADEITPENWYSIINKPGVQMGLSDPRFDAAGYRGLMALQLAEAHYGNPTIFENATLGRFRYPLKIQEEEGQTAIHIPEVIEPKQDSGIVMRGGRIQLIALLESGDIDYAFEYESVSQQHGFRFIPLPDAINLSNDAYEDRYNQVEVQLDFQRFSSVEPHFTGAPIGYGITIPSNAPHPELAAEFITFLLSPEGQAIMEANAHPLRVPARADRYEQVPESLQDACVPEP